MSWNRYSQKPRFNDSNILIEPASTNYILWMNNDRRREALSSFLLAGLGFLPWDTRDADKLYRNLLFLFCFDFLHFFCMRAGCWCWCLDTDICVGITIIIWTLIPPTNHVLQDKHIFWKNPQSRSSIFLRLKGGGAKKTSKGKYLTTSDPPGWKK